MDAFQSDYVTNPANWQTEVAKAPSDKFVQFPGMMFPIKDPYNLSPLIRVEEQTLLQEECIFQAEWLNLSDPTDLERLKEIWQRCYDGWYTLRAEEPISTTEARLVKFVRYTQHYYTIPPVLMAQLFAR